MQGKYSINDNVVFYVQDNKYLGSIIEMTNTHMIVANVQDSKGDIRPKVRVPYALLKQIDFADDAPPGQELQ